MQATRCPDCGETRWSLIGLPVKRATTCSACGTELLPERRLPGRRASEPGSAERRADAAPSRITTLPA